MKHVLLFLLFSSLENQAQAGWFFKLFTKTRENVVAKWSAAASSGNLKVMQELKSKVNINAKGILERTALMTAAEYGQEHIIKFLLAWPDIDINAQDRGKLTALILAVQNGHENSVKILLADQRINVNARDCEGLTALMWAILRRRETIIKLLLSSADIEINIKDVYGFTALLRAIELGDEQITKLLLAIPGIIVNPHKENILMWAANGKYNQWQTNYEEILSFTPGQINIEQHSAIILPWATNVSLSEWQTGYNNIIRFFLKVPEININVQEPQGGTTALMYARNIETLKILLQVPGIDINIQDKKGRTAFMRAAYFAHYEMVKALLDVPGIHINMQDNFGKTALMSVGHGIFVNQRRHFRINDITQLIKNKIDELTRQAFKAIRSHDLATLSKITAQIGAHNITDILGNSLLDKAFQSNNQEIIMLVLQNAQDPRELLASVPFEKTDPNSELFQYFMNLAYGQDIALDSPKKHFPKGRVCHVCYKITDQICAKCKKVYYCSEQCQKKDWKNHKHICKQPSKKE